MKYYRQLSVWRLSHQITLKTYRLTSAFPKEELFGLASQMRRAASSVPANLAEGYGRDGDAELKRFVTIAMGSASELDYHLLLATELGYIDTKHSQTIGSDLLKLRRMLGSLMKRLKPIP